MTLDIPADTTIGLLILGAEEARSLRYGDGYLTRKQSVSFSGAGLLGYGVYQSSARCASR